MVPDTKLLALDFGEKRIGIAVSDEKQKYSFARDHMQNNGDFFPGILKLMKEENVSVIIIGYPLNFKSEKTIQTEKTETFRNKLEDYLIKHSYQTDIVFYDERLTSRIAESGILNSGMKKKKRQEKGHADSMSAQIILQDYIDKLKNREERN
ncbi:MAG: Holliday junction resolvase RuvX [Bacteroidetes bacterium]|nr:Holliday junction resolvase RuvX [Bacteroidota bacterium]